MAAIRPLNDELKKIAQEELNEIEARIPEDLAAIKLWIEKQPHLRARTDDQFLIAFLRGCKYSLEKTKSKIDYYYTIQALMPEIFAKKRVNETSLDICRTGTYVRLPKPLSAGGPRIQFTDYSKFDFKKYNIKDLFRYQSMLLDLQIYDDDNAVISGYIEVIDLSKLSLIFLTQFDPILIKKLGVFADKAAPMRMKGVHIINCPREAQALINLGRSLLSTKIQKRFYVHKNFDELYKHIPQEYLPIEYGGQNGSIAEIQRQNEQQFIKLQNYFIEEDQYGVNEKLRVGNKIDQKSLFGLEGSFRKLNID